MGSALEEVPWRGPAAVCGGSRGRTDVFSDELHPRIRRRRQERRLLHRHRCHDTRSGGYRYQPYSQGPGYARTAAGVCVLQLCGDYEAKQIAKAVEWMENKRDDDQHYWYGHYYASHAFHQIGGKKWEDYYTRIKTKLLATQKPTGEWSERLEANVGPQYQTAIAVLILSVPANYLPIYQR